MAENTASNKLGEDYLLNFQALSWADHIRRRPTMCIGPLGTIGLHRLINELVEYSLAEISSDHGTIIDVRIHADGSLTIADNGRGIPVATLAKTGITTLEWVMTFSTGVEVRNGERVFRTSLHGVGARAVTALSDWAEAEVCCDGRVYRQQYRRGLPAGDVCDVGLAGPCAGTRITFHPDGEIFNEATLDWEHLANRLQELAFLNKGLAMKLADERTGKEETFKYEGGLLEFVQYLNRSEDVLHEPIYVDKTVHVNDTVSDIRVEAAAQYTTSEEERIRCYTNNAYNSVGGTHLVGFRKAVTQTVNAYGRKENLFDDYPAPSGAYTREGLTAVVSVQVADPQFESDNKLRLNTPEVVGVVASIINESFRRWLKENPKHARQIILKAVTAAKIRRSGNPLRD